MKKLHLLFIPLVFLLSCNDISDIHTGGYIPSENNISNDNDIIYINPPLAGKLPFPQHNPQFTSTEYKNMMSQLWIINNFGLFQGSEQIIYDYFHDGLDIVLDNGTKIYAVEDGYVRAVINSTLVIEDKDEPGYGWGYTHTNNYTVHIGDSVRQGKLIAAVNFTGLAHIHLSRYKLVPGGYWNNLNNIESIMSDKYFDISDSIPPVIRVPFYYFKDNSDVIFDSVSVPTVSGKVDIVVPMRDAGERYHSSFNFGDRVCVYRIEYEISSDKGIKVSKKSLDFSKITALYSSELYKKVQIAFKSLFLFKPLPPNGDKNFSYYIITNWDENHQYGEMTTADANSCWDTTELNSDGIQKFPNGSYKVKVKAYDFHGNSSLMEQRVIVKN